MKLGKDLKRQYSPGMMIPFERSWLRSPWFVLALVVAAVSLWFEAVNQLREIRLHAEARDQIRALEKACDQIARERKR